VLGHLSAQLNRDHLALGEVRRALPGHDLKAPWPIEAAPRFEPSDVFRIA
jgi:hypothetical protein